MNKFERLQSLDEQLQEENVKAKQLQERYDNGKIPEDKFKMEMRGIDNTKNILENEIENEKQDKGISEQEYAEAKEEWQQENEHSR